MNKPEIVVGVLVDVDILNECTECHGQDSREHVSVPICA